MHAPLRIRTADCARLGMDKRRVTGAIVGMVELYDVKRYDTAESLSADGSLHHAGDSHLVRAFGFMLRNPRPFRIPVPYAGQLGFFEAKLSKAAIDKDGNA